MALCGATIALAGCAKDNTTDNIAPVAGRTVIDAGIAESRTTLGESIEGTRKVYWSNGDRIAVNGAVSAALADVPAQTTSTVFTFDALLDAPYSAIYPASFYADASAVVLPAVQAAANGSFGANAAPMAAYSAEGNGGLQFHHLCAVVKLTITADSDHDLVSYVEFRGNAGEQVSGKFAIDYPSATLSAPGIATEADKSVRATVKRTPTAEGLEVYIVVPAGEYANGFTVKVVDERGHYMEKSTTGGKTLTAGRVAVMPAFAFVPTATELGVEIQSAADLVDFAKQYNAGEYASVEPLVVTLMNDIEFDDTTSAAFEPIGTINADASTNYFNGYFNGNGKAIKNWRTNVPLFAYTGGAGIISDLTIDASCQIVLDAATSENMGVIVGRHKGELLACTTAANITVAENTEFANGTNIAGLVGYMTDGKVESCTMTGAITLPATCKVPSSLSVAGIVGYAKGGEVVACTNRGTINDAAVVVNHYDGGIVGLNATAVRACKNEGALTVSAARNSDASRYISLGGIVGRNSDIEASVSNCSNSGTITSASDVKMQRIGGVVGLLQGGTLANNTNTGALNSTASVRQLMLGGLYGEFTYGTTLDFSADTSSATGAIAVSAFEASAANTYIYVGGLIGRLSAAEATTLIAPKCEPSVTFDFSAANSAAAVLASGGIVGGTGVMEAGKEVGGLLTITNAKTDGTITITASKTNTMQHKLAAFGGLVGHVGVGGVKMSGCNNGLETSENVLCEKSNGYAQHIGGFVGAIAGGDSEFTDCHNTGYIRNDHYNNQVWAGNSGSVGGIVGNYGYNTTFDGTLTITSCSNAASDLCGARGMVGGIAGYVRNATITSCTNTGGLAKGTHSYVGGMVGIAAKTAIKDCNAVCAVGGSSAGSEVFSGGGIVGILYTGSSVEGCGYYGTLASTTTTAGEQGGLIAGVTAAGTSISGCKAGGTLSGTTATADNVATLIAGDGNATVADCTLWNGK